MTLNIRDEISASPLNAEELAWAKKLDALFGKMPARLLLIEVDDTLVLVDRNATSSASKGRCECVFSDLEKYGVVLAEISNALLKVTGMTN